MNVLSDEKTYISNKSNLYNNFNKYFPKECLKYMAQTWNFKNNPHQFYNRVIKNNEVFIVRPAGTGAFSGKGIVIVHNQETFKKAIEQSKKFQNVIISKYINDPLLFEGRKFHLRTYFIAGWLNNHYVTKFLDFYELFTALKPYRNEDYNNSDIHDTHFASTPHDYICPMDLPNNIKLQFTDIIYPNMRDCMLLVSKMFYGKANPYSQAKNAFEIFGCDFLVRDNNEVILMEINDRIGFQLHSTLKRIELSNLLLDVINKGFIIPALKGVDVSNDFWLYKK
jgi:hypothetical protein